MKRILMGILRAKLGIFFGLFLNLVIFQAACAAVVDVMIVYDNSASKWVDSHGGMSAFSLDTVSRMNQALENSGLSHSFRLVHSMSVDYQTSSLDDDLSALRNGTGVFSEVHDARDDKGADLVAMVIDTGSPYGYVGLGYVLTSWTGNPSACFTVNSIQAVEVSHTLTHEVGHNLGAAHAKYQTQSPGPNSWLDNQYSSGWYFTGTNGIKYHTIMAYGYDGYGNLYNPAPYFSTPLKTYQGTPVGDDSIGDNSRLISQTFATVADYKSSSTIPVNSLTGLTISGSSTLNESSSSSYTATASWRDGSSSVVTPSWSENSGYTTINASGVLSASSVSSDEPVTVSASYSSGGETRSDTHSVIVKNVTATLENLTISGPVSIYEKTATAYTATVRWSDGNTEQVNPVWTENSRFTTIDSSGLLRVSSLASSAVVSVGASYSFGGDTQSDSHTVKLVPWNSDQIKKFPWVLFLSATPRAE